MLQRTLLEVCPKHGLQQSVRTPEGQYQVTVPRDLGDFFELKGKKLEWKAGSAKNKMEVIIHDE